MAANSNEGLLEYYKRELAYLRHQGTEFAQRYPKAAHRLALGVGDAVDPHVERLIESVAFLAARVRLDLDAEFPQITGALLDQLCPSLNQPVPSMSVAQFQLDPSQGKVTSGYTIARHTPLSAKADGTPPCYFRTGYALTLWPLQIASAEFVAPDDYSFLNERASVAAVARLELECVGETDFAELELDQLRLHLHGDWMTTMPLYEMLMTAVCDVVVRLPGGQLVHLPPESLREVGFDAGEALLEVPSHNQPAYRLLQEYFVYPRKFLFFDLLNLGRIRQYARTRQAVRKVEILLLLDRPVPQGLTLGRNSFRLGCTPIVNLFRRTSEPIRIDHQHYEYLLTPDKQREHTTEIHSIVGVSASEQHSDTVRDVPCYSALDHAAAQGAVFWSARRESSLRPHISGTDIWLSFVDLQAQSALPDEPVVYAQTLCTNRRLAEQLPMGASLLPAGASGSVSIRNLYQPTPQLDPPMGGGTQWRLLSLLTLNHSDLLDAEKGLSALKEMLALFNTANSGRSHEQIRGLRHMHARSVVARVGKEAWRGYCRGTEIVLEFDEDAYVGGSAILLSAVLARFFALYTSINAFIRVCVMRGEEVWKQWEPISGCQTVL